MKTDLKLLRAKIDVEGVDDGWPGLLVNGIFVPALQPLVDNRLRFFDVSSLAGFGVWEPEFVEDGVSDEPVHEFAYNADGELDVVMDWRI